MKGTMITLWANNQVQDEFDQPIPLAKLQHAVAGHIELVPYFDSFIHHGVVVNCVAFCNEEGKLKNLAVNDPATLMWRLALNRKKLPQIPDVLVGPVAIVFGDKRFMAEL